MLTLPKLRAYSAYGFDSLLGAVKSRKHQQCGFFHSHSASSFGRAVWGAARLAGAPTGLSTRTVPPSPFDSVVGGLLTDLRSTTMTKTITAFDAEFPYRLTDEDA